MKSLPNASCDLCGLPLRLGSFPLASGDQTYFFCCRGCKQVFRILMAATDSVDPADFQKTALFKKCQAMGIIPRSESDLAKKTRDSVSPTADASRFTHAPVETDPHSTSNPNRLPLYLNVSGMWCPACAWVIEETMKKDAGVYSAACYFSTDRVRCEYDPVRTSPEKIATTIRQLGYGVEPDDDDSASAWKRKEFLRFAISAFLTLNIMMLSFALYSGFFTELSKNEIRMISWPIFIMASIVFFYGGIKIHQRALSSFTTATFGMETLISVGSSITYLYSTYNFTMGSLHLYFDTAAMLITLVLLGKTLETKAKDEVLKDLDSFFSLKPKKVKIWSESDSQGRYVSIKQLGRGDLFRVEADEIVAADGIVMEGTGVLDESSLTGEARPVVKKPGDMIRSGSSVVKGDLKVKARRIGEESILGQMISIMEHSLERRTPLEGKTDRILQWFVPGVILLAFCAGIICLLSGISIEDAVIRSVTVLVISCPCALGIAIPLARIAGITVSARNGMLIRDFSCFERTDRLSDFVFDKTGTITHGQWELIRVVIREPFSKENILALAAGLEIESDHYIALAIQRYAKAQRISPESVQNISVCDNGVTGYFNRKKIKLGSWDLLRPVFSTDSGHQAFIDAPIDAPIDESNDENTSRVYMGIDDGPAAVFEFGDRVKDGAAETIKTLHIMGYATALISGDGDRTTRLIGRNIGIGKSLGGMLPTAKAGFVRDLKKSGHVVAMVGDGINDAPALAQSDLALAVHGSHLLGKEVADVSLMRGDPRQILDFLELAKKVNRKIQQNFIGAFLYNIISIPIAISGLLTPLVAVSAMLLSSLSVIGNTLLLIKGKS